ncbi:hypothetical protein [Sinomonas humi]|uniref:Uncharacterized protein n=1 Tax=Sinomonas humi TaxID=1338436 RepID=A0A0B2AKL5_9MICC|nr:hypothetical protein [Sinomonas humi]KHL02408.1 hypothetical protein LK10_12430 [Sinomonas humi]
MAESWDEVLGRLETDLDAVEHGLRDPAAPAVEAWPLPTGLGPIPERLVRRALALSDRQEILANLLEEAKAKTARHLAVVRSVPPARAEGTAIYLDVKG